MNDPVLSVTDLRVVFDTPRGLLTAVDAVSFQLKLGTCLALVGESGCGKTATALALMSLLDDPGRIGGGSIRFRQEELVGASEERLAGLRGNRMAMVFQEVHGALNPVLSVGCQVAEPLRVHLGYGASMARKVALERLQEVGLDGAQERFDAYPHELSGGQRQRVMIAMALACQPEILVADEPTTALDVTTQAQLLTLLAEVRRQRRLAMLFVTHDLSVLRRTADWVAVMYTGRIVEHRRAEAFLAGPRHPYAHALLKSVPAGHTGPRRLAGIRGQVPNPLALPSGCAFHPRCGYAKARCAQEIPPFEDGTACFFPLDPP